MSLDGHDETQLVKQFSLRVSIRELHNIMVIPPKQGGIKETRYSHKNIDKYTVVLQLLGTSC